MKASFLTRIFDLFSPRHCPVCGHQLSHTQSVLCASCRLHLPVTHFELSPLDNDMARRFWGLIPIERAAALFFYEAQSATATLIYQLKYGHQPQLGEQLGRMAAIQMEAAHFFDDIDAIVPVPLTRWRRWHRGYNQSMQIARGVSQVTGLPIYNKVVQRTTFIQSQTHLNHWQREANTSEAFRLLHAEPVSGKHLLLIDDIVTTGSTIIALATELQKAGSHMHFSVLSLGYTKS